jgi:hypothetical protein
MAASSLRWKADTVSVSSDDHRQRLVLGYLLGSDFAGRAAYQFPK